MRGAVMRRRGRWVQAHDAGSGVVGVQLHLDRPSTVVFVDVLLHDGSIVPRRLEHVTKAEHPGRQHARADRTAIPVRDPSRRLRIDRIRRVVGDHDEERRQQRVHLVDPVEVREVPERLVVVHTPRLRTAAPAAIPYRARPTSAIGAGRAEIGKRVPISASISRRRPRG